MYACRQDTVGMSGDSQSDEQSVLLDGEGSGFSVCDRPERRLQCLVAFTPIICSKGHRASSSIAFFYCIFVPARMRCFNCAFLAGSRNV